MVTLTELREGLDIASESGAALCRSVFSAKWVRHQATEYCCDFIVCSEVAFEMPVFCKIKTIVVKDDDVLLCGKKMENVF